MSIPNFSMEKATIVHDKIRKYLIGLKDDPELSVLMREKESSVYILSSLMTLICHIASILGYNKKILVSSIEKTWDMCYSNFNKNFSNTTTKDQLN